MEQESPKSKKMSRRDILQKAGTSAPMILTLGSGAALARTSNMISASDFVSTDGNYYCVETLTSYDGTGFFDLGVTPNQTVYQFSPEFTFRTEPNNGNNSMVMTPQDICRQGGIFHYHDGVEWRRMTVGNGGLLASMSALASHGLDANIVSAYMDT